MQVIFLGQDDRFYVRLSAEAANRYPAGAFNETQNQPVYALRFEGGDADADTYFWVAAADSAFYWVPARDARLARR